MTLSLSGYNKVVLSVGNGAKEAAESASSALSSASSAAESASNAAESASSAAENAAAILEATPVSFPSRAALVAAWSDGMRPNGAIVSDGVVQYIVKAGSTVISDLPGLYPFGNVYPDHFAENTNPGTTDMRGAIIAALQFSSTVYLRGAKYAVSGTISWQNRVLKGSGCYSSKIIGLSAYMDADDPILWPGRSAYVSDVYVCYDTLTGSEAKGERVGISLENSPTVWSFQRAGEISRVVLDNVGTGFYNGSGSGSTFSGTINAIEVGHYSYAGIDIQNPGTGTAFGSVYLGKSDTYTPVYGMNLEGGSEGSFFAQLNIEHCIFSGAALRIKSALSCNIAALHIEGVDTADDGGSYIDLDMSDINIGSLSVINTRMSYDDVSIFRLRGGIKQQADGDAGFSTTSHVKIGTYTVHGLAGPNHGLYPDYPSGRIGLENISGFKHFRRDTGHSGSYEVEVSSYNYHIYANSGRSYFGYAYPDTRYSDTDTIVFNRFDHRGTVVHPRENFVQDGAFQTWISTSGTASSFSDVEVLTNWWVRPGSGSIAYSRQDAEIGDANDYFMRISNIGTGGTYQGLIYRIYDYRRLLGKTVTLSFEGRASVAGRQLEQISCSLVNSGGTPASVYKQVIAGSSSRLDFTTDWQRFEFTVTLPEAGDVTTFGSAPYFNLSFGINDASNDRESQIDLRRVKIEVGVGHSDFSDAEFSRSLASSVYGTYGGSANAITVTAGLSWIATGTEIRFRATATNTGSATLNLDGLGAKECRTVTGVALPAGYILTTAITVARYDGTYWVLGREIETGNNANGRYVRFADGTQICTVIVASRIVSSTTSFSGFYRTDIMSYSFPASFTEMPSTSCGRSMPGMAGLIVDVGATDASSGWGIRWMAPASFTDVNAGSSTLTATGRWF